MKTEWEKQKRHKKLVKKTPIQKKMKIEDENIRF